MRSWGSLDDNRVNQSSIDCTVTRTCSCVNGAESGAVDAMTVFSWETIGTAISRDQLERTAPR